MNSLTSLDAYRSHDLNIMMKTSSGDVIKMDMSNESELNYKNQTNDGGSKTEFSFATQQQFKFSVESNGIDAQDRKEIKEFMKTAQPFIDNFMSELSDEQTTPLNKMAKQLNDILSPMQDRNENAKAHAKNELVHAFDNSLNKHLESEDSAQEAIAKLIEQSQKLLEKVMKDFDQLQEMIYA